MPGGPSLIFQCVSYALYGRVNEHGVIRKAVIDRVIKT